MAAARHKGVFKGGGGVRGLRPIVSRLQKNLKFKGGGLGGSTPPPPPEIFRFVLKSEGKEWKEKEKRDVGGGLPVYISFELRNFQGG